MATSVKVGSFTANTTTGNQAVPHGLGSTPKAIIFFSVGPSVTVDGNSGHANSCIGMAVSSTQRCVVSGVSLDTVLTSDTGKDVRTTACIVHLNNATTVPTVDAIADFVSFDATNFTINWTDAPAAATLIQFMVLGGTDLTNVFLGTITPPTSIGTQDITAPGFTPNGIFFLSGSSTATGAHDPVALGFAANNGGSIEQSSHAWFDLDAATAMRSWVSGWNDKCISYALATDALDAQASLNAFITNGFQLNWNDAATAGGSVFYLAMKGPAFRVLNRQKPISNQTETVTVGFQSRGLLFMSNLATINTSSATPGTGAYIAFGASDGTNDGTITNVQNDGNTASSAKRAFLRSLVLRILAAPTPTNVGDGNVTAVGATSFDLTWTNTNTVTHQYAVMVIGDAPAAGAFALDAQPGSYSVTGSAAGLLAGRSVNAAFGNYALTGFAATFSKGYVLDAASGSYALTGSMAGLLGVRSINAASGSYVFTGNAAGLVTARVLNAVAGSYTLSGIDANLVYGAGAAAFELNAEVGAYALSGSTAGALAGRVVNAAAGSYILVGTATGHLATRVLAALPGGYMLTGSDMELEPSGALGFLPPLRSSQRGRRLVALSPTHGSEQEGQHRSTEKGRLSSAQRGRLTGN
jgi:hypothetical protein